MKFNSILVVTLAFVLLLCSSHCISFANVVEKAREAMQGTIDEVKSVVVGMTGEVVDDTMDNIKELKHGVGDEATAKNVDLKKNTETGGKYMTTNQGLRVGDDQNSLKAGVRGPTLIEDHHFREKITHFDHERIPERVVHARGVGFHGYFQVYEDLSELTKASLFRDPSKKTPVFVRFSTVVGSRGSPDTPRDVRGFATKFYTEEGVWDLVGNNIPVFFIQDAIKFPDLIHAAKPEPHNEIPQAQTAHDSFWDFVSLTPESTHMLMWVMSDRAFPRSYSMMEGFGVHTFRFINAAGKSRFVKFHWKPLGKGVHSLVWDEAQKLSGKDPDYNRRDLWEAIEAGIYPEWELGIQLVEEEDEHKFDFDLLDATKIIPEELVPVRRIGKLVLNRNTDNFFAETEQVAFHPGHVVPGIDFTNDPLLQGRLFSYIDTQLLRVGPNFAELPINRPVNEVHTNQRDGHARHTINRGKVSYFPNSLAKGCPMHSPDAVQAYSSYMEKVEGWKIRQRSPSFQDHFSQATLFWNSMSDWEKQHIVDGFSFELNMVNADGVRARVVNELLANVDLDLATRVSKNTGIPLTNKTPVTQQTKKKHPQLTASAALSMNKPSENIKGRKIAILAGDGVDGASVMEIKTLLLAQGAVPEVIARNAGKITSRETEITVNRAALNAPSVIYDAVVIPGGKHVEALKTMGIAVHFVNEQYVHRKPIAALGEGIEILIQAHIPTQNASGIITGQSSDIASFSKLFIDAIKHHRFFDRSTEAIPA